MRKKKLIKIAMGIPNEAYTLPESYDNHLVLATRMGAWQEASKTNSSPYQFEVYWYTTGRLLTQMAREKLITTALEGGMDYLIMYDNDQTLPMDFHEAIMDDMLSNPEIDILGALAFMRNPPHYPVIYTTEDGYDVKNRTEYYIRKYVKHYPKDQLVECDAVGFGAVCIKLDFVRNKMQEPYFMSTTNMGEDILFCWKAKKVGGRVFMDTRIKLGHLSNPTIIDEEYFEKWIKDNKHDLGPVIPHKYINQAK
jgi:GT2 family glycosyltransferase